MPIYTSESKLCDILFYEPDVITVINRFGIFLGVGEASVRTICERHNIDTDFFLSILNTYLNDDYFPENVLNSKNVRLIVDYLNKTNGYYEQFQLPNIERHFNSLVTRSHVEKNNNLSLLRKFFLEMKSELQKNIAKDNEVRFPVLLKMHEDLSSNSAYCSRDFEDDPQPVEDKIDDLLSFFIVHLRGQYDVNLCRAVVAALFTLAKDIRQNNRIRRRILKPLWGALVEKNRCNG